MTTIPDPVGDKNGCECGAGPGYIVVIVDEERPSPGSHLGNRRYRVWQCSACGRLRTREDAA